MNTNLATRLVLSASLAAASLMLVAGCASSNSGGAKAAAAKPIGSYAFWPLAPDEPRIQYLGSFSSSEDVAPTESSDLERIVFGKDAVKTAYVNKPYGVAMRDGKIYVCDIRAKALVVLDLAKKQTRLVGVTGVNRLERPVAVALGDDGSAYVADGVHAAIFVFDRNERFVRAMTIPKLKPSSLALAGNKLYVADIARQQVLVIDRESGKELGAIGTVGDEDGQFRLPVGIGLDKAGNIYVADMMRCKVQKFSSDGKFLGSLGEQGDHAGGFARPKHLAVDPEGIIYVVDAGFQNVQMFNDKFQLLMHFGAGGNFPGAMNLPVGVAVTDSGLDLFKDRIHPGFKARRLIVVANQFGDSKIALYALGDRRPEYAISDFAATAAKVDSGVIKPSAETLKFQNIGGVEPGQEDPTLANPEEPAPKQPEPK